MTQSPSRAVKLFGTEEPPAETRILTAGPLTAELDAGNLRYISFGGHEAIRAISYVVRDQFWGTFNPSIADFAVEETADRFVVSYRATCVGDGQTFHYAATITGSADGTLVFEAVGTPETAFLTNRTGFVVLHPVAGVSGHPVEVLDVEGGVTETEFPDLIDPKQPIMDIRALTHQVAPGLRVVCTMKGDTFEMEDQRNWTDASYKTYVRPLGLPHPYTLAAGEAFHQSVTLAFEGTAPATTSGSGPETITVMVGGESGRVPQVGMALEARHAAAVPAHREALSHLSPAYLSCFLDARSRDAAAAMASFAAAGELLGCELGLEVVVPGEASAADELGAVARLADQVGARFASVASTVADDLGFVIPGTLFPDTRDFDELYAAARAAFPEARIGGGNFVYFTEMNRKPPPFEALDFVCHGTSALVHAADDRSVTETLECLPYIVKSGRALFGDRPYRIGPAGIGSRTSPFGNDPTPNPMAARVTMTRADPRQRGLLGAAWHLGYAARMAESGVDSVTLGAPLGEFGLLHHAMDYGQPWYDEAGGLYPVYQVMRGVYAASGAPRLATTISGPRNLQALAFRTVEGVALWLANLTGEARTVSVDGLDFGAAQVCILDEQTFDACAADPEGLDRSERPADGATLMLAPYAVARLQTSTP